MSLNGCASGPFRTLRAHGDEMMSDKGTASNQRVTDELRKRIGEIIDHAWRDADFRALCQADPRRALAAHGVEVPENLTLVVVENTPDQVHLVIPPAAPAAHDDGALADDALEQVAGGAGGQPAVSDNGLLILGSAGLTLGPSGGR